ncbi:hypothetical protein [Formosa maritima]|uniref:WG repeat-containing protein n=1 Tax=Formosa maritima TaxID=2592046 RepID=A0A5D0G1S3_9FLAO|nr:hypothetical protein [Formosa maritima]TYA52724.1 hypothetical protein FVF61_11830 [Formosa maritima]
MKKKIRLLLIIPLLIGYTNQTFSQNGREKTIMFTNGYNVIYSAIGQVSKNKFVENKNVTFLTERDLHNGRILRDTIVSGKYFTKDGNSYIDGLWKQWDRDFKELVRVKGVFKVSNNENGIGITTNKKKGKGIIINVLSENPYYINISYKYYYFGRFISSFSLESNITNFEEEELDRDLMRWSPHDIFDKQILNDKKVKFSFKNGDVFIGSIKRDTNSNGFYYHMVPHIGEYKYKNGDIINGEIYYYDFFGGRLKFYPEENSYTVFEDGTVEKGEWVKKYFSSLNNDEKADLYKNCESLTELRDKSKIIIDKKNKKIEEKEKEKEKERLEKLQKQIKRQKELTSKYGDYYGNKLSRGELLPGMNEDMVKEVWEKEWFNINNIVRNGQMIEIWEFDKSKMQRDIIKKGKESGQQEGALGLILMLNLSEELGLEGINAPKTLVFMDNKLTDIYR